jgi:hypothetical protein
MVWGRISKPRTAALWAAVVALGLSREVEEKTIQMVDEAK